MRKVQPSQAPSEPRSERDRAVALVPPADDEREGPSVPSDPRDPQGSAARPRSVRDARGAELAEEAAELCRRVAAGEGRAFSRLTELYQHRIFSFCVRMVKDRHEAEDLAQDVFLSVYRHAGEFRGEASFNTWIYRIARNHALNRIKYLERRGRSTGRSLDEVGEDSLRSDRRGPDALVEGEQTSAVVRAAIERLPRQQREVLVLRDLEGLPYEDITEITGLALGTVKSRIHRARSALAERLSRILS